MNAVGWIGRTLRKSREEFSCFFGNSTVEPGVPLRRGRLDALDTSGFLEGRAKGVPRNVHFGALPVYLPA